MLELQKQLYELPPFLHIGIVQDLVASAMASKRAERAACSAFCVEKTVKMPSGPRPAMSVPAGLGHARARRA